MVYYLALGILSNTLIIPFFFSLGFQYQQDDGGGQAISLSMVASVVAGVSGLMTGGLHLFLRSTTVSTIGPRGKSGEYERHRMKDRIRHYGGSEPDFQGHMMGPVGNGADLRPSNNGRYDMSSLKPPPSMNNLTAGRHRRDSSMASSATVQIGLRLSNVEDFAPMDSQILDKKVYNLYMSGAGDAEAAAAAVPGKIEAEQQKVAAAVLTQKQEQQQPLQSSQMAPTRRPSPLSNLARLATKDSRDELASVEDASPVRDPVKDARMKTLPPVPHLQENVVTSDFSLTTREDALLRSQTLEPNGYNPDDDIFASGPRSSPSVYSQQRSPTKALLTTKLPSPRGVGFAPVSRSNSSAVRSTASTLRREASSASHTGVPGKTTSDWI
ncbi:hypothetical protein HMPREF1624_06744 [Sporothrix schenckii ATCC 58251]|uniref:Uncharacterized protein n=1 Tax=Sporothrix schenckii (strain ATCC 58251 / de Perez 2211183) TaxID=1391915 RepID=U7PP78_SPOS1|nr:hypothetical protein HMPREF1624_06744 [Sporothrix schenckii ATCC 58251]